MPLRGNYESVFNATAQTWACEVREEVREKGSWKK